MRFVTKAISQSSEEVIKNVDEIRRQIEALDTRMLTEHRKIQILMADMMALWDSLVRLEEQAGLRDRDRVILFD
jgi:spore maturation protein SpmA